MITVFTPTFNRAYKLGDLYDSLKNQSRRDFEWLIIDDGSSDETETLVRQFIDEKKLNIRYIYKKNEGKQIAINLAAVEAKGEWIFIVDSDDTLTDDALETVEKYCMTIDSDGEFAGVVGLRGNAKGEIWESGNPDNNKSHNHSSALEKEFVDATTIEYRFKYKISGDRAEVIKRSVLLKYPFPKIEGETFIPEGWLWYSLGRDGYKFRWFNRVIYITEYLEDGLTRNGKELAKKNCIAKSVVENLKISISEIGLLDRYKATVNYYRYGLLGNRNLSQLYTECNSKVLSFFAFPIVFLTKIR